MNFSDSLLAAYEYGCVDPVHIKEYHGMVMGPVFQDWLKGIRDPRARHVPRPPYSWTSVDNFTPLDFAAVTAEAMKDIRKSTEVANALAKLSDEELLKGLEDLWNPSK